MPRKLYLIRGSSGLVRIANLIIERYNGIVQIINGCTTGHNFNIEVYNQHIKHLNNADRILRQMREAR
jgi:hypothetical protein